MWEKRRDEENKNSANLGVKMSNVDHPKHYNFSKFETIDVIKSWDLDFCLGNVVKYISRAGRKLDEIEDLKKAKFYLEYYLVSRQNKPQCSVGEVMAEWGLSENLSKILYIIGFLKELPDTDQYLLEALNLLSDELSSKEMKDE